MSEVSEAEARRRYIQGELDAVLPSTHDGKFKIKILGLGESKWLNITADQYAAISKILIPEEGVEPPTPDTSINIYLTGDEDGPDMFGVIYNDEDAVMDVAEENEVSAWRVPTQPYLDRAERLESDSDE